jgi:hypothetical protein
MGFGQYQVNSPATNIPNTVILAQYLMVWIEKLTSNARLCLPQMIYSENCQRFK